MSEFQRTVRELLDEHEHTADNTQVTGDVEA
jgi:hypothetical protein